MSVVGVAVTPLTDRVEATETELDNRTVVDQYLATSLGENWTAGDTTNAWHPISRRRFHLKRPSLAPNHGSVVARHILNHRSASKIPYGCSDQYDLGMEYSGNVAGGDTIVHRGDPPNRELVIFWLDFGRVVANMGLNFWDVAEHLGALVSSRRTVDPRTPTGTSADPEPLVYA